MTQLDGEFQTPVRQNPYALLESRAASPLSATPRPFLRWAGSKQRLLRQILPYIPTEYSGNYYEPFLGAGALFFLLEPEKAVLSDTCEPLIETYEAVRNSPSDVIRSLGNMDVLNKQQYYEIRDKSYLESADRAARFIYLNRAAWNGLYRVNNKGKFNVPYGRPRSANLVDADNLSSCSKILASASVSVADFENSVMDAKSGDLVYFDPPYVTGHNNNGFVDYNEKLFSWEDQQRLARLASELKASGVHVVVSNANHPSILSLYPSFRQAIISRRSALASDVAKRKSVTEVVFY
ncbi:DNA adenine methylase [Brevibacterium epidermidis]|uniref:Site-specific DNA-methyltransferase (adenine-specific) n=1 Tax=Brevibacterium epidermidis TaxID=1698 RepID=A0ABV4ENE0_BREEP